MMNLNWTAVVIHHYKLLDGSVSPPVSFCVIARSAWAGQ